MRAAILLVTLALATGTLLFALPGAVAASPCQTFQGLGLVHCVYCNRDPGENYTCVGCDNFPQDPSHSWCLVTLYS